MAIYRRLIKPFLNGVIFLIMLWGVVHSASKYGGGPYSFYKISFSPRETAMAGVGVVSSEGPLSVFWNPANLLNTQGNRSYTGAISLVSRFNGNKSSFLQQMDGVSDGNEFNCIAIMARPEKWELINFGLSIVQRTYSNLVQTDLNVNDEIVELGSFNADETMILLSPAVNIKGTFVGSNIRFYRLNYPFSDNKDFGFAGVDIGLNYNLNEYITEEYKDYISNWQFGMTLFFDKDDNITSNTVSTGLSVRSDYFRRLYNIGIRVDLEFTSGSYLETVYKLGTEIDWQNILFIRGGIDSHIVPAVGGGIQYSLLDDTVLITLDVSHNIYSFFNIDDYNLSMNLADNPLKVGFTVSMLTK